MGGAYADRPDISRRNRRVHRTKAGNRGGTRWGVRDKLRTKCVRENSPPLNNRPDSSVNQFCHDHGTAKETGRPR